MSSVRRRFSRLIILLGPVGGGQRSCNLIQKYDNQLVWQKRHCFASLLALQIACLSCFLLQAPWMSAVEEVCSKGTMTDSIRREGGTGSYNLQNWRGTEPRKMSTQVRAGRQRNAMYSGLLTSQFGGCDTILIRCNLLNIKWAGLYVPNF